MLATEIDFLDLGIVLDLLGGPLLQDASIMHHRHALRDPQRDVEIVLDDDVADVGRQRGENVPTARPATGRPPARRTG